jgi:hypothetical protein
LPPPHVATLEEYWVWVENLIPASGGWLAEEPLLVRPIENSDDPDPDLWKGLVIESQRVEFADGSFLQIREVLDELLATVTYSFHHQAKDGSLIWRKDNHPGHFGRTTTPHIHKKPSNPNRVERYEQVDLEEALQQVMDRLSP